MTSDARAAKVRTGQQGVTAFVTSKSVRRALRMLFTYTALTVGGLVLMTPLIWLLSSSLQPAGAIFSIPPRWIPSPVSWQNYADAWRMLPFPGTVRNTLTITFFAVLGTVVSASLVAFGFARLRFALRDPLFMVLLATMMIPHHVTLIPVFVLFRVLGWLDTFYPLTIPAYFGGGAFNVFLLRQFYMTLPLELDDAARIDGCSTFQIYRQMILPQARPALGIVAIFGFLNHWNDFFGPLIYLNSRDKYTLALALNFFKGEFFVQWHLLLAGSVMSALPCILLYFVAQRYFIQGIVFTGIKG